MSFKEAYRRRGVSGMLVYAIQAAAIQGALETLSILPLSFASGFGSLLFRTVGPFLKADKVARRNLAHAFPDWDQAQIDRTVRDVWDNLGRGAGEFAHVTKIDPTAPDSPVTVIGLENLLSAKEHGAFILLSAHIANWEMAALVPAYYGIRLNNIYRHADNPWMDKYFRRKRGALTGRLIPKGVKGIREIFAGMKRGEPAGVLIDQKLNEGRPIPFFGRDAMTATAPIEMAVQMKLPIVPVQLERVEKTKFILTFHPWMELPDTGDRGEDAITVIKTFNAMLESWIRKRPGQWFWVHKRWPN